MGYGDPEGATEQGALQGGEAPGSRDAGALDDPMDLDDPSEAEESSESDTGGSDTADEAQYTSKLNDRAFRAKEQQRKARAKTVLQQNLMRKRLDDVMDAIDAAAVPNA